MRAVHIHEITAKRAVGYDPDFHGMIDQNMSVEFSVLKSETGRIDLHAKFAIDFKKRADKSDFGKIEGVAEISVKSKGVEPLPDGSVKVSPEVQRVIEGALSDEIMLPVSTLARAMKFPSILRLAPMKPEGKGVEETARKTAKEPVKAA